MEYWPTPEPIPDFRVSHVVGILQLVLPGQASTQPLDHAVAQNLQVTSPARNWKHNKASQPLQPPSTTPFTTLLMDSSGTKWVAADPQHFDSFPECCGCFPISTNPSFVNLYTYLFSLSCCDWTVCSFSLYCCIFYAAAVKSILQWMIINVCI